MDLSASLRDIIDEFNRRRMRDKAQAGQGIGDMLGLQKKPADWFQQMQQGQNAVVTPEQRSNVNKELADMLERFTAGVVPEPIRARERAMRTDPSAAAKPFTSEEVKGITPFVTAAAPIAYHGTPHTFDKFDASKIGTGQGAQSYGHGLYFAENPQVANSYLDAGRSREVVSMRSKAGGYKIQESSGVELKTLPEIYQTREAAEKAMAAMPQGNTYQVNIPDQHAAKMLDWDKPLSEQAPEVQKALADLRFPDVATGNQIWDAIKNRAMSRLDPSERKGLETYGPAASAELNRRGIPGIKYLDQGSRTAGQGTHNFVVFDPAILEDVTKK